jgi:uncharacterized protein (TIGR03435 family)
MVKARLLGAVGIVAIVGWVVGALAQVPASPAFEVASIKPNNSGPAFPRFNIQAGGRVTMTNFPLREIIRAAYQMPDLQLVGGPDWINSRFDIVAKAVRDLPPAPSPPAYDAPTHPVFPLLRSLLAERFKLAVHQETRELPIYALVMARADRTLGPRLTRSTTDCASVIAARQAPQAGAPVPPVPVQSDALLCGIKGARTGNVIRMVADSQSVAQLVQIVTGFGNRVVVDQTNLTGLFSFDFSFTPDDALPAAGAPPLTQSDNSEPSFFTALREQLGLKLESTKGPVDVLVIDHVEHPTED